MKNYLRYLKSTLATYFNLPFLYRLETYSQEGEDILLRKLFHNKKQGFYVDIGAHHPFRYSNTYWFYRRGWSGVNIDATPGSMNDFKRTRKRDTNKEKVVGTNNKKITYYLFSDSAFNTMSQKAAKNVIQSNSSELLNKIHLPSQLLSHVLDETVPKDTQIDFLTIDVEGKDLEILKTNNWLKYLPTVICVEVGAKVKVDQLLTHPVTKFLQKKGYRPTAKLFNSALYTKVDNE